MKDQVVLLTHPGARATVVKGCMTAARFLGPSIVPLTWTTSRPHTLWNAGLGEEFAGVADHGRGQQRTGMRLGMCPSFLGRSS